MKPTQWTGVRAGAWLLAGLAFIPAQVVAEAPGGVPPVAAQDANVVALTAAIAPDRDALWILDREARKLAVYRFDNAGLSLIAVRDLKADFRFVEFSNKGRRQNPSVFRMKKAAEDARKRLAPDQPVAPVDVAPMPIVSLLMTKGSYESGRDVVQVIDSTHRKLAVYTSDGRSLILLHMRDLRADLKAVDFTGGPPQSPTVAEVVKATKKKDDQEPD